MPWNIHVLDGQVGAVADMQPYITSCPPCIPAAFHVLDTPSTESGHAHDCPCSAAEQYILRTKLIQHGLDKVSPVIKGHMKGSQRAWLCAAWPGNADH